MANILSLMLWLINRITWCAVNSELLEYLMKQNVCIVIKNKLQRYLNMQHKYVSLHHKARVWGKNKSQKRNWFGLDKSKAEIHSVVEYKDNEWRWERGFKHLSEIKTLQQSHLISFMFCKSLSLSHWCTLNHWCTFNFFQLTFIENISDFTCATGRSIPARFILTDVWFKTLASIFTVPITDN